MGVKSLYLLDQTDLFKIGNLVYGGKGILLNVYSSLQGQRRTVYDVYGKLVVLKVVSVKIYGLRSFFWKNWHCKLRQFVFLGHSYSFRFARKYFMLVTLAH